VTSATRCFCLCALALAVLAFDVAELRAQVPVAIPATTRPDFNGDGREDLVVGVPGENIGAGAVQIFYGSLAGLGSFDQFFSQSSPGVPGGEQDYDHCGTAVAAGDFNGDGFADLAFGCPGEDAPSAASSGAVIVLYGSSIGLTSTGSQYWGQNSSGINGSSETNDRCGAALAAGDFNRDGFADLVWGCPGEKVNTAAGAGAVNVLFGTSLGLTATGNRFLSQDTENFADVAEGDDRCGSSVTSNDFNGDGFADIAWGCPGEDIGLLLDAGAVSVAFGIAGGISGATSLFIDQNTSRASTASEGVEAFDECGRGLASGDFNNDGRGDLVIGCPGEDVFGVANDVGSLYILWGVRTNVLSFGQVQIPASNRGRCGASLSTGRFNSDQFEDIVAGCPNAIDGAGSVHVYTGTSTSGSVTPLRVFTQNTFGVPDSNETGDNFGHAVTAADFDANGFSDLAIGVPNEDHAAINAGSVIVIYFPLPADVLNPVISELLHQDSTGILDTAEVGDNFGFALPGSNAGALPGLTGRWDEQPTAWCRGGACQLTGTFTALNPSILPTPTVALRFYLSSDQTLDDTDVLLARLPVKPLGMSEAQVRTLRVTLTDDVDLAGYYVIAFVDADDEVLEVNEDNNFVVSSPIP
jgi:hypothetical protein